MVHRRMPWWVLGVVLAAALLHALWNLGLKSGPDPTLDTLGVALGGSAVAAMVLPFLPPPARASWPFIALSAGIHTAYFLALAAAYREGEFGPAYTLMRGSAPLLVTLVTAPGLERVAARTWLGVLIISAGILWMGSLSRSSGRFPRRALAFALLNGCVIAGYTVADGTGVRRSGHALSYVCWVFAVDALPLATFLLLSRGRAVLAHVRARWPAGALGGSLSVLAYGLVLWAMTRAPIPAVAAVRETSVVFGTLLGTWRFHEALGARRVAAAALVAVGVLVEQLGPD